MMKSLSSAVSGLEAQQTAMNVIGNNIANVNTTGFRSSTANFEDLYYQTLNAGNSEVNPSQVGYGSQVSGVTKNMTSAGATQTDNPTDLYIDGKGYFAVNTQVATDGTATGQTYYTRVGHLSVDSNGFLVDGNGNYVMSAAVDSSDGTVTSTNAVELGNSTTPMYLIPNDGSAAIEINGTTDSTVPSVAASDLSNIAIGSDGTITATANGVTGTIATDSTGIDATTGEVTDPERIVLANFVNESGLTEAGNNYYTASQSSGAPSLTVAGSNSAAGTTNSTVLRSDALEMSNVDLASEFTNMIITERGFQANARVITVSDSMLDELLSLKRS
jgi:flagellar hook protein FlgE